MFDLQNFEWLRESQGTWNLISSAILILTLLLFRWAAISRIRKWDMRSSELRRKWIVQIRNWTILFLLLGLVIIWASEIRSAALSLAAIAVALVIATKELILCFAGSFLKASTQAFQLGDRIRVQNFRGDVIDQNLICTKILEVGPWPNGVQYTGCVLTIPNSVFIQSSVANETLSPQVCLHTFDVVLSREVDKHWPLAEKILLEATERVCKNYLEDAKTAMSKFSKSTALSPPSVEPRVSIEFLALKDVKHTVRLACLPNNRWKIEQAIIKRFKRRFYDQKLEDEQENARAQA